MDRHRRHLLAVGLGAGAALAAGPGRALTVAELFPVVETAQGKLQGLTSGGVHTFKGVRYGADTAGKLRFRPPAPPPKWTGVRDALNYGPIPPQGPDSRRRAYAGLITFDIEPGGMGEDCLVLNLWTPTLERHAKRPVIFSIHGGGYVFGSGNTAIYDGEALARFGDCVVVTINHRLGAFGYLNLADQDPDFATAGSAGMQDIVAALRWVKENIEAFGGDPNRVLAFGQSGGGAKTSMLMAMPSAKGLFHRAGVQSGSRLTTPGRVEAQKTTRALLKTLAIPEGNAVRQLQTLPYATLLAAQLTLSGLPGGSTPGPQYYLGPSLDRELPSGPFDPAAPEVSREVPLIIGTCLDDGAFGPTNYDLDEAGLEAVIARQAGADQAKAIHALYRAEDPIALPFTLQGRIAADSGLRQIAALQAERKAAQGGAPVWTYLWSAGSPSFGGRYGAVHAIDLGPSFHNPHTPVNGGTSEMAQLSDQIAASWVAFAATGDPNNPQIPHWPAFTNAGRSTLVFDTHTHVETDPRRAFLEVWRKAGRAPQG
ncbi:carboxylesterase/lipase family protein [Phenylobacterium sp.]|uniref:carboxylesterase/lipase family protein n=1 Tax=Phenylobacterium sp. TaxID=1871053 RepID=UPI003566B409